MSTLKTITVNEVDSQKESTPTTNSSNSYFIKNSIPLTSGSQISFRVLPQPVGSIYDWTKKVGVFYCPEQRIYRALTNSQFEVFSARKKELFEAGRLKTRDNPNGVDLKVSYKDLFYVYTYAIGDEKTNQIGVIALPSTTKNKEPDSLQAGPQLRQKLLSTFDGEMMYPTVLDVTKASQLITISVTGTGISTRYNFNILPRMVEIPADTDFSVVQDFDSIVNFATTEEFAKWLEEKEK